MFKNWATMLKTCLQMKIRKIIENVSKNLTFIEPKITGQT